MLAFVSRHQPPSARHAMTPENVLYLHFVDRPGPVPPKAKPWFTIPGSSTKFCWIADLSFSDGSSGAANVPCTRAQLKKFGTRG
jgi:hypothetical protein